MTLISRPELARRKLRLRKLLHLPLSDQRLLSYSSERHEQMINSIDGAWVGPWLSPLGGYLDAADGRDARKIVDYVEFGKMEAPAGPTGPLAPGIVAELLYANYMRGEFEHLVSKNLIAYEHILRLERLYPREGGMLEDAQTLARISRTKKVAMDIVLELGIGQIPQETLNLRKSHEDEL